MATLLLSEISVKLAKELGAPSSNVELDDVTIQEQWLKALNYFNEDVGLAVLEELPVTTNVQNYDLLTILASAPIVRKVIDMYVPNTTGDIFNDSLFETPLVVYDPESIVIYNQFQQWNNIASNATWALLEPMTFMVIPAPKADATYKILVQKEYDILTLPDKYEHIVSTKARALCLDIIYNARSRLSTPMRGGDFVSYKSGLAKLFEQIEKLDTKYDFECKKLITKRTI
jgi:hypothetical protein